MAEDVESGKFRRDLLSRINLWSFRLPGLADRREDIEPNLDYELQRYWQRTGKSVSFNREARARFLAFARDPANNWEGNFRDLNAMVVRMATLSEGGRITAPLVGEEIERFRNDPSRSRSALGASDLEPLLGAGYETRFDAFDLAQLAYVVSVCRESTSMSEAAKKLFAVSRKAKKSVNDSDRLSKYLAKFGLKFKQL